MERVETLFESGEHRCVRFGGFVSGEAIPAYQFLIIEGDRAILIDPGGPLTFTSLAARVSRFVELRRLESVLLTHQDPDILGSIDHWLALSSCKVFISRLWVRFLSHMIPDLQERRLAERIVGIPDEGMQVAAGPRPIEAVPAHFLHSPGNFSYFDTASGILFTGDIGSCEEVEGEDTRKPDTRTRSAESPPVMSIGERIEAMTPFHLRYMGSGAACRRWVSLVRPLNVRMIAPHHAPVLDDPDAIEAFLRWMENLECGMDLWPGEQGKAEGRPE